MLYIGSLVALFLNSAYSLNEDGSGIDKTLTLGNYREITKQVYRDVAVRTIVIALAVTVIDVKMTPELRAEIADLSRTPPPATDRTEELKVVKV